MEHRLLDMVGHHLHRDHKQGMQDPHRDHQPDMQELRLNRGRQLHMQVLHLNRVRQLDMQVLHHHSRVAMVRHLLRIQDMAVLPQQVMQDMARLHHQVELQPMEDNHQVELQLMEDNHQVDMGKNCSNISTHVLSVIILYLICLKNILQHTLKKSITV